MRDSSGHFHRDPSKPRQPRQPRPERVRFERVRFADMSSAIHNRKAPRMTATQLDSEGNRSMWNDSPYYRNLVAFDSRWSA